MACVRPVLRSNSASADAPRLSGCAPGATPQRMPQGGTSFRPGGQAACQEIGAAKTSGGAVYAASEVIGAVAGVEGEEAGGDGRVVRSGSRPLRNGGAGEGPRGPPPPSRARGRVVKTEGTGAAGTAARWTSRKRRGRRLTRCQYC